METSSSKIPLSMKWTLQTSNLLIFLIEELTEFKVVHKLHKYKLLL